MTAEVCSVGIQTLASSLFPVKQLLPGATETLPHGSLYSLPTKTLMWSEVHKDPKSFNLEGKERGGNGALGEPMLQISAIKESARVYLLSSHRSVFELLLFFDERDFHEEPLKHFSVKFQECYSALLRHQNVHLVQVEPLLGAGGAWANTTLKEILSESNLPQNEVDRFLSSELPVFLELRVRYLISCQRVSEALALAKCCVRHPSAGKHLFFLQVYLTWLYKTQYNQLLQEVADLSGKDAVHIICSLENEETNELLLALCQVFLSQQLCRGDMYYLWELVFIWSKLHHRLNTSKEAFLEESRRLMLSATNVNAVFPFVRVVIEEG
ncbi:zinc finger protein 292-like [Hippocampus comes]|uniref:zinc finger protein 292-like n=1 Tax=Hippocampus comes TaxID=109280 RepID=UPI00094E9396|nr:PREDICTED: zinc finger protein 292-like [Hippocampus comes]